MSTEPTADTAQATSTALPIRSAGPAEMTESSDITAAAPAAPADHAHAVDAAAAATTAASPTTEKVGEDEVKVTASPVTEGVLAYKAPGLLKSLVFSKKYFWLGSEPVEHSSLAAYIRSEKADLAHHNVAHASHTGEGLLLFSKRAEDKSQPEGILNLYDATDLAREPACDFSFKLHGQRHSFHAATIAERDGWLVAIENIVRDASSHKEGVVGSDAYKNSMTKFGKGAAAGAVAGTTAGAVAGERPHDGATDATAATASVRADHSARGTSKSRSQSRKRQSIFGGLLAKKNEMEDQRELKKEEKAEAKELRKEGDAEAFGDKRSAAEIAALAVGAPVVGEETASVPPISDTAATTASETSALATGSGPTENSSSVAPAGLGAVGTEPTTSAVSPITESPVASPTVMKSKRTSMFGSFFTRKDSKDRAVSRERDIAPAVPAKDHEALPTSAAGVPAAAEVSGLPTSERTPSAGTGAAGTTHTEQNNPLLPADATPEAAAANQQKPGGDLFHFLKMKKGENTKDKEIKAEDKVEGTSSATAPTTAPVVAPVAVAAGGEGTPTPDTKRRSSFFNTLGGKKERRSEAISGDEGIDAEGKKKGLGGLFRKSSKSIKPTTEPIADPDAPPIPISKDVAEAHQTHHPVIDSAATETAAEPAVTETTPAATSHTATAAP